MWVRTFAASSTNRLDRKVNAFLADPTVEVLRIQLSMSFGTYAVLVEYEPRPPEADAQVGPPGPPR